MMQPCLIYLHLISLRWRRWRRRRWRRRRRQVMSLAAAMGVILNETQAAEYFAAMDSDGGGTINTPTALLPLSQLGARTSWF